MRPRAAKQVAKGLVAPGWLAPERVERRSVRRRVALVRYALIWRLVLLVKQRFRKLNGRHRCAEVDARVVYRDDRRAVITTVKA